MPKPVTIIKIDPERRIIARMSVKPSIPGVRILIGCSNIGHRVLLQDAGDPPEQLIVGARVDQDPGKPKKEWRLRGGDNTVGVGILFGTKTIRTEAESRAWGQPIGWRSSTMWHVPVDVEWVKSRIIWCEPGEDAPAAEVTEALGLPAPDGDGMA